MSRGSETMGENANAAVEADGRPVLSVVLATLNERGNLPELFARLRAQPLPPSEFLVVDDGSSDGTREFVRSESERDPRFRLLVHDGKQTTLRAQCQGIAAARGRYLVVMDADLQHPPETLPALVRALDAGSVLVVASRYAAGGSPGPRTLSRRAISRGAEWIAKLVLPPARRLSDPVSGFFGFRAPIWYPLNPLYRGYKLLLFVLMMAGRRQRVSEVGFRFEPRTEGGSKVTESTDFVRVFLVETLLARRFGRLLEKEGTRAVLPAPSTSPRS